MSLDVKYPKTPYWPWSPSIGRRDATHPDPGRFVGEPVVVTEKLDGGNTLLHAGKVYARSVAAPSEGPWMAMVKKHHAWKVNEPDAWLYGEDIYGVHSIEYGPVPEQATFHAFALRDGTGAFASFTEVEAYAKERDIPVVPVLFNGSFQSVAEARAFIERSQAEPSVLGGEREGLVLRLARGFPASEFPINVCKSVRPGHVQTDEHWTRSWKPCRIARISGRGRPRAEGGESGRAGVSRSGIAERGGAVPAAPEAAPQGEVPLAPDYLRRIARVEAMPENASGADKTWVHKAHADAVRHLRSAKRR